MYPERDSFRLSSFLLTKVIEIELSDKWDLRWDILNNPKGGVDPWGFWFHHYGIMGVFNWR